MSALRSKFTQKRWLRPAVGAVVLLLMLGLLAYLIIWPSGPALNVNNNNRNSTSATLEDGGPAAAAASELNRRGEGLFDQGKYAEAAAKYREAVEMQPSNSEYHHNLAKALCWQRNFPEAEAQDREAVRLVAQNLSTKSLSFKDREKLQNQLAEYQDLLAFELHQQGRYDEAVEWSQKATQLNQYNAQYFVHLGDSLRMQGKWDEAHAAYNTALFLDKDNKDARTGLQNGPLNQP